MTKEQAFFIDVINILPLNSVCYLQAPDLSSKTILFRLKLTEYPYYKSLELNQENKNLFIESILHENIQEDIQSIEVRNNDTLLFEGFDCVEYGTISRTLLLSDYFKRNYINDNFCNISEN